MGIKPHISAMKNYSPQEIRQLVQGSGLNLLELWESGDLLQRQGFCWVNVLAKK